MVCRINKNKGKLGEIALAESRDVSHRWENVSAKAKGEMLHQFRQLTAENRKELCGLFLPLIFISSSNNQVVRNTCFRRFPP